MRRMAGNGIGNGREWMYEAVEGNGDRGLHDSFNSSLPTPDNSYASLSNFDIYYAPSRGDSSYFNHGLNRGASNIRRPASWFYAESTRFGGRSVRELDTALAFAMNPANITREVAVPSSDHVAAIVGRKGVKICALQAETGTYIETPGRDSRPVFMVRGSSGAVDNATQQIHCAVTFLNNHQRHPSDHQQHNSMALSSGRVNITTYVRVPLHTVGLVVGPKGSTIRRIQADTGTHIMTPSKHREPVFEVSGHPHGVAIAKRMIMDHICLRAGSADEDAEYEKYMRQLGIRSVRTHSRPIPIHGGQGTEPAEMDHDLGPMLSSLTLRGQAGGDLAPRPVSSSLPSFFPHYDRDFFADELDTSVFDHEHVHPTLTSAMRFWQPELHAGCMCTGAEGAPPLSPIGTRSKAANRRPSHLDGWVEASGLGGPLFPAVDSFPWTMSEDEVTENEGGTPPSF